MTGASEHDIRTRFPTNTNPRINRDFVITLKATIPLVHRDGGVRRDVHVRIRYVPDRLICEVAQMTPYFNALDGHGWASIEELANTIADDFSNELIPRWINVSLSLLTDGIEHSAHVMDKQPLWDNPALIQRLD